MPSPWRLSISQQRSAITVHPASPQTTPPPLSGRHRRPLAAVLGIRTPMETSAMAPLRAGRGVFGESRISEGRHSSAP